MFEPINFSAKMLGGKGVNFYTKYQIDSGQYLHALIQVPIMYFETGTPTCLMVSPGHSLADKFDQLD